MTNKIFYLISLLCLMQKCILYTVVNELEYILMGWCILTIQENAIRDYTRECYPELSMYLQALCNTLCDLFK